VARAAREEQEGPQAAQPPAARDVLRVGIEERHRVGSTALPSLDDQRQPGQSFLVPGRQRQDALEALPGARVVAVAAGLERQPLLEQVLQELLLPGPALRGPRP